MAQANGSARTAADQRMLRRVRTVCALIEAQPETRFTLADLAARVHSSPGRLQRRFKALVGVSPMQYARACRLRRLRHALRTGGSVTEAVHAAGFGSTSRVYEQVGARIGMTPGQYRTGGADLAISYAVAPTPLGVLLMAATDRGLCAVQFGDDEAVLRAALAAEFPAARIARMPAASDPVFDRWMQALRAEIAGGPVAELPLDVRGTAFRLRVWSFLQRIPRGETRSYAAVARALDRPGAARAVAGACAANRLALVIPCHRVLRGDGGLGGYRWGAERKRALLAREGTPAGPATGAR